jgi:DNA-binding transcriptional MerR regulator
VQPYVLRSWEAEFPDLGISKSPDGPRLYRRADVELVLKLRDLLLIDGLTLAGARRRLIEEGAATAAPDTETITDADVAALVDRQTLKGLRDVRQGLGWILEVLNGGGKAPALRVGVKSKAGRAGQKDVKRAKDVKSVKGTKSVKKVKSSARKTKPAARGRKKR